MSEKFEVVKLWKMPKPAGATVGNGKLQYGVLEVSFRVMKRKSDGSLFVSLPSHSYEKDGETKWANDVYIENREASKEMNDIVLAEWEKMGDSKPSNKPKDKPASSPDGNDDIPW